MVLSLEALFSLKSFSLTGGAQYLMRWEDEVGFNIAMAEEIQITGSWTTGLRRVPNLLLYMAKATTHLQLIPLTTTACFFKHLSLATQGLQEPWSVTLKEATAPVSHHQQKVKNVQLQVLARRCLDTSASFPFLL